MKFAISLSSCLCGRSLLFSSHLHLISPSSSRNVHESPLRGARPLYAHRPPRQPTPTAYQVFTPRQPRAAHSHGSPGVSLPEARGPPVLRPPAPRAPPRACPRPTRAPLSAPVHIGISYTYTHVRIAFILFAFNFFLAFLLLSFLCTSCIS